jgi:hypothetical protein
MWPEERHKGVPKGHNGEQWYKNDSCVHQQRMSWHSHDFLKHRRISSLQ